MRAERAAARRAKLAEPLQALSGPERKSASSRVKPRRNFQEELHDAQGFPNWRAIRALAEEWRAEVVIFDQYASRNERYTVEWGGRERDIPTDFNDITGYGTRGLSGGERMRYWVKCLDDDIKENEPGSLQ